GARPVLLTGLTLVLGGLAVFMRVPVESDYIVDLLPAMLLVGIGGGLAFPAMMTLAMSGATPSDAGLASGLVGTTAQAGGALGLAVLATLATSHTERLVAGGQDIASALTDGYQLAFGISAAFVAISILLAAAVLRPQGESPLEAAFAGERRGADADFAQS